MNVQTGSYSDSFRLIVELNSFDNLETEPLLKNIRASILSDKVFGIHGELPIKKNDRKPPPDKFYLAILFSFFSGMAGIIPMTFFLTANDYWMYKLRDTAYDTYDLNNKTFLQKMFASMNSIGTAIPSMISVLVTAKFAHKIDLKTRFTITLGFDTFVFILFTSLIKINTDSWQTLFFIICLAVFGVLALLGPLFGMSNLAYLSRFPTNYMKINMFGSAVGALFGSTLQVVCLAIGGSSTDIALIYFSSGTFVMLFTFCLSCLLKYSPLVTFYLDTSHIEEHKKITHTLKEYWESSKAIWPIIVMSLLMSSTQGFGHPNISSLVVSEGYDKDGDNVWYNTYFVVVATYFFFDFFQFIGRIFAMPWMNKSNYWFFILIAAGRSYILAPLYLFCNAQPRSHLPVWFPHDYQYMIIHATYSLSMSILMTVQFMSIPNLAGEKAELAYIVMSGINMFAMTMLSPINPLFVTML